jgi:hypothetical protein
LVKFRKNRKGKAAHQTKSKERKTAYYWSGSIYTGTQVEGAQIEGNAQ